MLERYINGVKAGFRTARNAMLAKSLIQSFSGSNRAQMQMADRAVSIVVAIVVAGLLAAFLLPIAIEEISGVDTSGWDPGAAELWDILPIMIVLAIFLFFVGVALRQKNAGGR